jgi:hypothetical protein
MLHGKTIICEKPLVGSGESIPDYVELDKVHLGIEWLYHPKLTVIGKTKYIKFVHAYPPASFNEDKLHYIYDLGSHVISIFQHHSGCKDLRNSLISKEFIANEKVNTSWLNLKNYAYLHFGYDLDEPGDTVHINNVALDWIPFDNKDLFYIQLKYVIEGGKPLLTPDQIRDGDLFLKQLLQIARSKQ